MYCALHQPLDHTSHAMYHVKHAEPTVVIIMYIIALHYNFSQISSKFNRPTFQ